MPRRKKTSSLDDYIDLITRLPRWAGVLLAVLSYLLLHQLAGRPTTPATRPDQMATAITQAMLKAGAGIFQYVVPLICLAGAGASACRRRVRRQLVSDVAQSRVNFFR